MNNFQYIKNYAINREKWDKCISGSINSRVYGFSWYLDIVCKNWDGIIFGDYEAVFPVVFKKIFFLKKSYHPLFCQQLGLFYKNETIMNNSINFISYLHQEILLKYFKSYTYCATSEFSEHIDGLSANYRMREDGAIIPTKMTSLGSQSESLVYALCGALSLQRINLQLDLKRPYNELKNGYSNNTIRNLKKSAKFNLKIKKDIEVDLFMDLYTTNKKIRRSIQNSFIFKNHNYLIIKKIISTCLRKKIGQLIGVYDQENNLISASFFLSYFNRVIMLFNISKPQFKQYHAMTFLIDDFIKTNCNEDKLLDFEGSNIEGVRNFYNGFGSSNFPYYIIKSNPSKFFFLDGTL